MTGRAGKRKPPAANTPPSKATQKSSSNNVDISSSRKPLAYDPKASQYKQSENLRKSINITKTRQWRSQTALVLGGITLLGSFYATFTYNKYKLEAAAFADNPPPADNSKRFQAIASDYDDNIGWGEWFLGISNLRAQLLAKAQGHVLEASVGTGRNAGYYPLTKGIQSVTMVDQSSEMVRVARMNWAKTNAWFIHAMFRIQSAKDPVQFPVDAPEGFDTVVQTMGVCSTGDPVGVLKNLGLMCKPEGRILLLEHGQGKYDWMNRMLDEIAPVHADRWGCWFNKDVGQVVQDSGLEIVEQRRYHFGTTWWFVLKPPKDRTILQVKRDLPLAVEAVETAVEKKVMPWWSAWWR